MSEQVDVHLLGVPVGLHWEASQHNEELMREFSHLDQSAAGAGHEVPGRLLALSRQFQERFSPFTRSQAAELGAAAERGDSEIDLVYRVPVEAAAVAAQLASLLDEADRYCAAGEHLLTLTTPAAPLAYRTWFLAQFVDQVAGAAPVSWADWPRATPGPAPRL